MRFLALIFMIFTMCFCKGNLESRYIEKMTHLLQGCTEKLDESYGRLLDGDMMSINPNLPMK